MAPLFSINSNVINTQWTSCIIKISVTIKLRPDRAVIGNEAIPAPAIGYRGVGKTFSDYPCKVQKDKQHYFD